MRTVTDKSCIENQDTHVMFNNFFFNHSIYELMWKTIVEPGRPQMTARLLRIACWIPKATNTRPEYVIFLAFPLQQWWHESASMLLYTYIGSPVSSLGHLMTPFQPYVL